MKIVLLLLYLHLNIISKDYNAIRSRRPVKVGGFFYARLISGTGTGKPDSRRKALPW